MTCPHCAHFARHRLPGAEGALHRHRQGALHPARIPARSARRRAPSCWRAAPAGTNTTRWSRRCSRSSRTGRWRSRSQPLMAIAKQAGFTEQTFEACLTNQKCSTKVERCATAPPTSSRSTRRRPSSSTARTPRGRHVDRGAGEAHRALSQDLIFRAAVLRGIIGGSSRGTASTAPQYQSSSAPRRRH